MNENKLISIMKIVFNPFRVLSLFFKAISSFFGVFADLFDRLSGEISTNINIVENNVKKIYINDTVEKVLILLLLVFLFFLCFGYLKGIL